ncbi:hypothetical protein RUM44_014034 [Polyplax serrata]|uniref:Golgi resident protein GCP60 n=1 Tax=Polyplax serrata TaxID=468196 RepID=A0ABR1BFV6_POLSC
MAENCETVTNLTNSVDVLDLNRENGLNGCEDDSKQNLTRQNHPEEWGFSLQDLYKLGLKFYKDKEGKAINLTYQNKLHLVALSQQISQGPYNPKKAPPLGVLDVIGKNRRDAWQALGDMAQKTDLEEKAKFEEEQKKEKILLEMKRQEELKREEEERAAAEERKRQIQDALNAHTFQHFKAYAEEQYPGNPEQQAILVRQLQEQHYHQYMQQLMQQQHQAVQTINTQGTETEAGAVEATENVDAGEESDDGLPRISPPSMWTRKDIKDFKESIRKEGGDAIIKVGHGETVTVRVPTHEDGTCLFWEFATDSYDIGFGVYFEWTKSPTNQVSVHIQDSEDEDDDLEDDDDLDDDEEFGEYTSEDVEKGSKLSKLTDGKEKPLLSAIVPIYRRDCQDEVYAGSHAYPGEGVYLLKFDNSYSLWRSKTLYYRVYYTR